jgi:hypothetical protein
VSLDKDRKLQFEEILEGVGALCGSAFIDSNFDDWMIKEFGTSYTELEENERNLSSHFFAQFEDKKKSFTGPDHARRITVGPIHFQPAPKTPKYDKRNNNVILQAYVVTDQKTLRTLTRLDRTWWSYLNHKFQRS